MPSEALRVLIVDDDAEDAEIVSDLLREESRVDYAITAVTTYEEGLEALTDLEPAMCMVDYRLGARSGVDFIREAGTHAPAVPIVLMTGGGGADVDRSAMEAGAVDYLPKADITADRLERTIRYAVERARRQRAEARFRALIENGHDLVSIIAPDGTIEYVSSSLTTVLGFDPHEKTGAPLTPEIHPEDRARVVEQIRRVTEGQRGDFVRLRPHRVRHSDGRWRLLEAVATNHIDDPSIGGVVVHATDVTEQVATRERIRFQADLLSAVGQAVIATDLAGEVLYWNPAAERLYGWTRKEAMGKSIVDLTSPRMSHDQAEEILAAVATGETWSGEWEVKRKDGSTFVALVTDSPITDGDGEVHGVIGVSSDITQLKETEAALRERVKELRTLHAVSNILNDPGMTVEARLQRIVERLPEGWLYPKATEARIVLGERVHATDGFGESPWTLRAPLMLGESEEGRIEVAVMEPRPERDLGPFIREERDLLDNLARLIGDVLIRERLGRRLGRTVAALNEAVFVVRGGTIVDANPAASRIFGFPREALVGSSMQNLYVDRGSFEQFGDSSRSVLERGGVFRESYPMRRSDGSSFQAEQTVSLLNPEEGFEGGVVKVIRDVSERARAEAELRASEERLRQIAESIDDVFWISTPDRSRFEYVSPAFAKIWNRPVDEVIEDAAVWTRAILPSDRERTETWSLQQDEPSETEYRILRPDGDIRWIFDRAFPVREEGEVVRVIGVAEDITDRKLAEERFALLSQEVADGIHVMAPDGRILFATASAQAVLGYPSEELTGKNALDLVHPEDRASLRGMLREIIHRPGWVSESRYRGVTQDGEVRYLESVGRNRIDHPAIGGVVVTTRDVTERRRLEDRLRQSQKMEAIGRLAGGIAHDFNNLLTVIRSQTDLLLIEIEEADVPGDGSLEAELQTIQSAADRAASLTSQLLAFSREQVLQPRVVDLSWIVADVARLIERVIGEDVTLERDLEEDLPAVRVDPAQLEHVIMNLAVNARDAMPAGGTLTLRTRRQARPVESATASFPDQPPTGVALEVADTGTGMDAETRSHIFEPFFTTKEKGKGTGLGLAMVYGVVTQSGGTVQVESELGQGSVFTLSFPAVDAQPERPDATLASSLDSEVVSARILVVEDDEAVRRVTVRILERVGMEVVAVESAEVGLEQLGRDDGYDLLITDLVLPEMSGRALVEELQANSSEIPVIVISGYAADSLDERGGLPEHVTFVQKPFTPKGLVRVVGEVLSRRSGDRNG